MPQRDKFYARLNETQARQLSEKYASDVHVASPSPGPYAYTLRFHSAFKFPTEQGLVMSPTVTDRLRRGRLILEETLETLTKGLGLSLAVLNDGEVKDSYIQNGAEYVTMDVGESGWPLVILVHEEGHMYDPVETADGIGDINVVANGTAIEFGIPMPSVDHEIYCSNMTKLVECSCVVNQTGPEGCGICNETGKVPIINGQTPGYREGEPGYDSSAPVGKGLKPDTYTPANIARVLQTHVEQFGVTK